MHSLLPVARKVCQLSSTRIALSLSALLALSFHAPSAELRVGKVCPVQFEKNQVGHLIFSKEWYHSSRSNAKYQASDNATGIGLEIHMFANTQGHLQGQNIAGCDKYRMVQIRTTNTKLMEGERPTQVDIPDDFETPFYDAAPLEYGYGVHLTPEDNQDKPWHGRPTRASTVAIYDTPYASDGFGIEGQDIQVEFETCVVCGRESQYDSVLSCGSWGYKREFMGGMTGWAEPEFLGVTCSAEASDQFRETLDESPRMEYSYWLNWR